MNLLTRWRQLVAEQTTSRWPGPRPMRHDRERPDDLVGREDDCKDFERMVRDHEVTVFTGASGVGKSSMLEMGLLPTLRKDGWQVLTVRQWSRLTPGTTLEELVFQQNRADLPALVRLKVDSGAALIATLDDMFRDRSVIILDQFEELMRDQRKEFQQALRWITETASEHKVRIVISLRVEHEHELSGTYGLQVGPYRQTRFELAPITDVDDLRKIIEGKDGRHLGTAISQTASNALLKAWKGAGTLEGPADRGLLHLQALLYVLWIDKRGGTITPADITRLRAEVDAEKDDARLYSRALTRAVQVSLDACQRACEPNEESEWPGIDPVLSSRALDLIQAMSGHLSSGGFKVTQAREELARLVIFREGVTGLARSVDRAEPARRALAVLVDAHHDDDTDDEVAWLEVSRTELFGAERPRDWPWELDPLDLTGGVLLGLRPEDSLLEEYRAFYFGLEWLYTCELVRLTTASSGQTMVTLVHDLFGRGLNRWSEATVRGAEAAIHQFAAVRGVEMNWKSSTAPSTIREPVATNLRWRACDVSADFEGITFVNCDFRGTRFFNSTFDGVAFVNCMLDDVEFLECTITGAARPAPPPLPPEQRPDKPPAFFVAHAPEGMLASLRRHREVSVPGDGAPGLYSQTAGIPAVPGTEGLDPSEQVFKPQPGGLSMFGGRVSSLKVRACEFGKDGWLSLRGVAGTSVEFNDQLAARVEIDGSAIRGLTITRPVDAEPDRKRWQEGDDHPFDIRITDSRIVNVWFGIGLRGAASFDAGPVWQLFNAADRKQFKVTIGKDRVYGVVNAEPNEAEEMGFTKGTLGSKAEVEVVELTSRIIDYRKRPLPSELEDNPYQEPKD